MLRVMPKACLQVDADHSSSRSDAPHRRGSAIAQSKRSLAPPRQRDARKCLGCGEPFKQPAYGQRQCCEPCRKERKRFINRRWRQNEWATNPDYRERGRLYRQKRSRAAGIPTREEADVKRGERHRRLMPRIHKLLAKGLSCAEVGERIGLSKNAVIGLVNRDRNRTQPNALPIFSPHRAAAR